MADKPQRKRGRPKGMGETERETMSALRLQQVEDALLSGYSKGWCEEHFGQVWGVTDRQVRNYVARVEEKWAERNASPERREEARQRCLMLIRKYGDSDVPGAAGAAVKAADMLHKIDGVYAPQKVEHSGAVDVRTLTPQQRAAEIAALLAKAGAAHH